MKKTTTVALTAALGATLLLGGAGTLAFWTDTKTSATQTINSGNLSLGALESGNWKIQNVVGDKKSQLVDLNSNTRIVPGDVLTQTVQVPVTLVGENLKANLTVSGPQLVGDNNLKNALSATVVSINGQAVNANGSTPAAVALTPTSVNNGKVPVVISVTFPFGTAATAIEQMQSTSITSSYTLTQVPAGS